MPPPSSFIVRGGQGGEEVVGSAMEASHCPSSKGRPRPLTLGENPPLCAQIHPCCHTAFFLIRNSNTCCHFAVPQRPRKRAFPCLDPHPVIESSLCVASHSSKCQASDRVAPGSSSSALSSLILQSHPRAHDFWHCGNVAGIRSILGLGHLL